MTPSTGAELADVELRRERWRRARDPLGLLDTADPEFATGGLALLTFSNTRVIPPNPEAQKGVGCDYALNPWLLVSPAV